MGDLGCSGGVPNEAFLWALGWGGVGIGAKAGRTTTDNMRFRAERAVGLARETERGRSEDVLVGSLGLLKKHYILIDTNIPKYTKAFENLRTYTKTFKNQENTRNSARICENACKYMKIFGNT